MSRRRDEALELYVFHRTPSTIDVRDQRATTDEEIAAWADEPGWARARRSRFSKISAGRTAIKAKRRLSRWQGGRLQERKEHERQLSPDEMIDKQLDTNFRIMEQVRARVRCDRQGPKTAEALKPYYPYGCKRPTFHDEYLPTFNRPNVFLVDTGSSARPRDNSLTSCSQRVTIIVPHKRRGAVETPSPTARPSGDEMHASRFLAPLAAVGALALLAGGAPAGAQTTVPPTVVITVVAVTPAQPTTTTTKPGAAVRRPGITCENARNHGEWVSSRPKGERAAAAKSDCGKPKRRTTTLAGSTTTVTTTPTSASSTALATSTTKPRQNDDQDENENDQGKGKGKGNNGRGNGNAKGKGKG